ncbi:DMP19 family protein [Nocardioides iriomotensis]|uniref:DMP19 family protein n=1 Tax=Nocardioides iriomotensis TaxID=715784 RepID=UPI003B836234
MSSITVWSLYQELSGVDPKTLTPALRELVLMCDLFQEVSFDGLGGYFGSRRGNSAEAALRVLPDLLGEEWAEMLEAAMRLLGEEYPASPEDRAAIIEKRGLARACGARPGLFRTRVRHRRHRCPCQARGTGAS